MTGEVVPIRPQSLHRMETGQVTRINRWEDLSAGQYWRSKEHVPGKTKAERRERGVYLPEDHPLYRESGWMDENRTGSETYMVDVPIRDELAADRVHLVRDLRMVDGEIHAVVLQHHPSEPSDRNRVYLLDEFLAYFEFISNEDAEAVRRAEIDALQVRIADLQTRMIAGPPDEAPVALLGHTPSLPGRPSVGTMIANIDNLPMLQSRAEQAITKAETQSKWITDHVGEISKTTHALLPFFQEKANAALASTKAIMTYAEGIRRGVQSIGLYVGTDVETRLVADGQSAPADQPLHLHRTMLFMDEEFVINLDAEGRENGADHEDFDDFVAALRSDPKLLARVLPHPRMVVLMSYRRKDRIYFKGTSFAEAMANAAYNQPNKKRFLLIRDGERITQVWSALTTQEIGALFPTKAMGDSPFRGADGSQIGPDDLDLSKAKGKLDDLNRVYKNLLVLLWGLNDREQSFGRFYDPADMPGDGFLSPAFQDRFFRFDDPESVTALGSSLPRFERWVAERNAKVRSGSRVLVLWNTLKSSTSLGLNEINERQPQAIYHTPDRSASVLIAKSRAGGHAVPVHAGRDVRTKRTGRQQWRDMLCHIDLSERAHGYTPGGSLSWLCLDAIESADIDHYLESRIDRPRYMEFYTTLLAARDFLRLEEAENAELIGRMVEAFEHSGTAVPDGSTPRSVALESIRLWRASNKGASVPPRGAADHQAAWKTLLGTMWTLSGAGHPIPEAEAVSASEGRIPLRLCMTGKDRFVLYATSAGDEVESRLFDHPWVTRISCRRTRGILEPTARKVMALPDSMPDEQTLHEWPDIEEWRGRDVPKLVNRTSELAKRSPAYSHSSIRRSFAVLEASQPSLFLSTGRTLDEDLRELKAFRDVIAAGRYVKDVGTHQPLMVLRRTSFASELAEGFANRRDYHPVDSGYVVVSISQEAWREAWQRRPDELERRAILTSFLGRYGDKTYMGDQFKKQAAQAPYLITSPLSFWPTNSRPGLKEGLHHYHGIPLDPNWRNGLRAIDVGVDRRKAPDGRARTRDDLWAPTYEQMLVWAHPDAEAVLDGLCKRDGYDPVAFAPDPRSAR